MLVVIPGFRVQRDSYMGDSGRHRITNRSTLMNPGHSRAGVERTSDSSRLKGAHRPLEGPREVLVRPGMDVAAAAGWSGVPLGQRALGLQLTEEIAAVQDAWVCAASGDWFARCSMTIMLDRTTPVDIVPLIPARALRLPDS